MYEEIFLIWNTSAVLCDVSLLFVVVCRMLKIRWKMISHFYSRSFFSFFFFWKRNIIIRYGLCNVHFSHIIYSRSVLCVSINSKTFSCSAVLQYFAKRNKDFMINSKWNFHKLLFIASELGVYVNVISKSCCVFECMKRDVVICSWVWVLHVNLCSWFLEINVVSSMHFMLRLSEHLCG